jgi:hypothetical protein
MMDEYTSNHLNQIDRRLDELERLEARITALEKLTFGVPDHDPPYAGAAIDEV